MRYYTLLIFTVLMLSGCAQQMPPLNFSVPNVGPSQKRINAELKSLTVTLGRPDEVKGQMPVGIEAFTPIWKESLEEALNRMALFKDDSKKKVSLSVKVLAINLYLTNMGINLKAGVSARYELLDRSTGAIIYTETIESTGETPYSFSLIAAVRLRESTNRAVQNNISKFLMAIETINVNKPLFPGRK